MNNYVAKHMAKVNKPSVEPDKKKEEKLGHFRPSRLAILLEMEEEAPTNGSSVVVDTPNEEE